MEENIIISNLNDFIFCPRSIYFHNLFSSFDESLYHTTYQVNGKHSHNSIDTGTYSTSKNILQGINVYSEEFGIYGKIDLFDLKTKTLIERKRKITIIYEGYYLQIYAQFFCLIEMGYDIKKIQFRSVVDNKVYNIPIPGLAEKDKLKNIIQQMNNFSLTDPGFKQNKNKCVMCIYKELCDYYKNDE